MIKREEESNCQEKLCKTRNGLKNIRGSGEGTFLDNFHLLLSLSYFANLQIVENG